MKTTDLMMKLIRSQFPYGKAVEIDEDISTDTIKELFNTAERQDVTHLIAAAFSAKNAKSPFDRIKLTAVYRREQLNAEEAKICELLEREGIDHIPLKGAVIRRFYPEEWMRTSCDIDILVKKDSLDRAIEALKAQFGYEDMGRDFHDHSLKSKNGVHLELHFSIEENDERLDKVLSRAWDNAVPVDGYKHRFGFTSEYLMFHLIAHTQYHFISGGCGVKPFIDLWVLEHELKYDPEILNAFLKESESEAFFDGCKRLINVWFNDGTHDELTSDMEEYILSGGAFGTIKNRASAKGGRFKYILSRVFLSKKELTAYYPKLESKAWLLPYYQIKRWFALTKNRKSIPVVNSDSSSGSMFKELGL